MSVPKTKNEHLRPRHIRKPRHTIYYYLRYGALERNEIAALSHVLIPAMEGGQQQRHGVGI